MSGSRSLPIITIIIIIIIIIIIALVRMEAFYSSVCIRPRSHLGPNLDKFVLITKNRQIPVISWPSQVRPTCLNADKT